MSLVCFKNGGHMWTLKRFSTIRRFTLGVLGASVLISALGCSSNQSRSTPPSPSSSRSSVGDPTPPKTSSPDRNNRDKEPEDEDPPREPVGRNTRNDPAKAPPTETTPKPPPLDPALARKTCDAPPIQGDAKKLIFYINNPNPPGGRRLSDEEYRNATLAINGIDVNDPSSLKILQDQLDAQCKKI